jgi:hypothetical protein
VGMEMLIWNALLTTFIGLLGWILKEKSVELHRLGVLINKTREEVAREYVTKVDVHNDINRVLDRLDRLDTKLDAFIKEHRNASR